MCSSCRPVEVKATYFLFNIQWETEWVCLPVSQVWGSHDHPRTNDGTGTVRYWYAISQPRCWNGEVVSPPPPQTLGFSWTEQVHPNENLLPLRKGEMATEAPTRPLLLCSDFLLSKSSLVKAQISKFLLGHVFWHRWNIRGKGSLLISSKKRFFSHAV